MIISVFCVFHDYKTTTTPAMQHLCGNSFEDPLPFRLTCSMGRDLQVTTRSKKIAIIREPFSFELVAQWVKLITIRSAKKMIVLPHTHGALASGTFSNKNIT